MRVSVARSSEVSFKAVESCLLVPVFEQGFPLNTDFLPEEEEVLLQTLADKEVLQGKAEEMYYLPTPSLRYKGILAAGLGKRERFSPEVFRRAAGKACTALKTHRVEHVYLDLSHFPDLPPEPFLEGLILGQYDFDLYKQKSKDGPEPVKVAEVTVLAGAEADVAALEKVCRRTVLIALSANGARHLANTSANEMTPSALADFARGIAKGSPMNCTILDQVQMSSLGMNALLGVAKGSAEPPKLIVLEYHFADSAPTLALVGKGVTFDTGGLSLKPPEGMHEMKYDMCGAAAVLCTMMTVLELAPAVNVVGVVPAAENKTGAAAQTPGDIVRAYNGKSVEVHNTDAEGRLLLADALAYTVDKYKPSAIIDVATLTGACVVALGHYAAGLLGNDEGLIEALGRAAEKNRRTRLAPASLGRVLEADRRGACGPVQHRSKRRGGRHYGRRFPQGIRRRHALGASRHRRNGLGRKEHFLPRYEIRHRVRGAALDRVDPLRGPSRRTFRPHRRKLRTCYWKRGWPTLYGILRKTRAGARARGRRIAYRDVVRGTSSLRDRVTRGGPGGQWQ